jgi:hypothetical protein
MAIAKSLSDIPFDTLEVGECYFLVGFTPEMIAEAGQRLNARAEALGGFRGIIRRDSSSPLLFIGMNKDQLAQRTPTKKNSNPPGRPIGIEARLLAALEVDGCTILSARDRTSTSIRNLVSRTAKRHQIALQATAIDGGEYFKVTRTR